MKVGDLVRYEWDLTAKKQGYGIVLNNDDGFLTLFWWDDYADYIMENATHLEVISASR